MNVRFGDLSNEEVEIQTTPKPKYEPTVESLSIDRCLRYFAKYGAGGSYDQIQAATGATRPTIEKARAIWENRCRGNDVW